MLGLTKEEAIRRHRLMWNWISEESIKRKRCMSKREAFEHFAWDYVASYCWCCEFTVKNPGERAWCQLCPLDWPEGECAKSGLYKDLIDAKYKENDYAKFSKLAKEIAELPEKR